MLISLATISIVQTKACSARRRRRVCRVATRPHRRFLAFGWQGRSTMDPVGLDAGTALQRPPSLPMRRRRGERAPRDGASSPDGFTFSAGATTRAGEGRLRCPHRGCLSLPHTRSLCPVRSTTLMPLAAWHLEKVLGLWEEQRSIFSQVELAIAGWQRRWPRWRRTECIVGRLRPISPLVGESTSLFRLGAKATMSSALELRNAAALP